MPVLEGGTVPLEPRPAHPEEKQMAINLEKRKARIARWYSSEGRKRAGRKHRLKIQGWTEENFATTNAEQEGKCAICGDLPEVNKKNHGTLCGDHEHTNPPQPRGLLCSSCNAAIGLLKDSSAVAENAMVYLMKWGK